MDGPAGTGASVTDGLALYVDGIPVSDMHLFTKVESVDIIEEHTLRLTWGQRGGATAAGITDYYSVDLQAVNGTVLAVAGDVDAFNRMWAQTGYLLS